MRYSNPEHTVIQDANRSIPTDPHNTDYAEILASGVEIDDWVEPEKTWAEIRGEREALLKASDWMAMPDRTMINSQSAYRQGLRDIPQDFADTAAVIWPTIPE